MFGPIFERFVNETPVSVMARATMERVLNPQQLDEWFDKTAQEQYTRDLLFSSIFELTSQVVLGSRPSIHAAYQSSDGNIGVSITSVYNKLNGIEPNISAELVRYAVHKAEPVVKELVNKTDTPLPGFRIKLLDGNCIKKSEHRIKELRSIGAGPLPGKSLVVYDPALRIPIDVFPCEDGHAQERSLLNIVLKTIMAKDVWIADRNFCTVYFTCGIASLAAFFIIREHGNYPYVPVGPEYLVGETETGTVYEQLIKVVDQAGKEHIFRRCRIILKKETRDGDKEIAIITNLPKDAASAIIISELYRTRWKIETAFQNLAVNLKSEINTLGYPRAALFGFCVALIAYIVFAVIKAAIENVHGKDVVDNQVSEYYLSDEITGTARGMDIAIPADEWERVRNLSISEFVSLLQDVSMKIKLPRYRKHPRGPKKPMPKRTVDKKSPHVSTAKILAKRNKK
ncbi:MAG: transposase [Desulfobacterales bacterium]|jgi:IS4 transposase